jgi:hypothetical protein
MRYSCKRKFQVRMRTMMEKQQIIKNKKKIRMKTMIISLLQERAKQ